MILYRISRNLQPANGSVCGRCTVPHRAKKRMTHKGPTPVDELTENEIRKIMSGKDHLPSRRTFASAVPTKNMKMMMMMMMLPV
jgi:hypothetical protein